MTKEVVYAKADEKFVKTVMLYANGGKSLFYDKEAKTEPVKKAELKDLFIKGVTVFMTNAYYAPVMLNATNDLVCSDGTGTAVKFTAV